MIFRPASCALTVSSSAISKPCLDSMRTVSMNARLYARKLFVASAVFVPANHLSETPARRDSVRLRAAARLRPAAALARAGGDRSALVYAPPAAIAGISSGGSEIRHRRHDRRLPRRRIPLAAPWRRDRNRSYQPHAGRLVAHLGDGRQRRVLVEVVADQISCRLRERTAGRRGHSAMFLCSL